jgi:hypothetical protein
MTCHLNFIIPIGEVCANVKRMGYCANQRIRLYGDEFEVISDPFPEAGGITVSVKPRKGGGHRLLRLPTTLLQGVRLSSLVSCDRDSG